MSFGLFLFAGQVSDCSKISGKCQNGICIQTTCVCKLGFTKSANGSCHSSASSMMVGIMEQKIYSVQVFHGGRRFDLKRGHTDLSFDSRSISLAEDNQTVYWVDIGLNAVSLYSLANTILEVRHQELQKQPTYAECSPVNPLHISRTPFPKNRLVSCFWN